MEGTGFLFFKVLLIMIKRYVFGSGLLVSNVLALSIFTQGGIASEQSITKSELINIGNQLGWRVIANNTITAAECGNWITDELYSESIRNVIGKAIADCITEKNEFANKGAEDVITFDVDPTRHEYSQKNYNALVLWNLIHVYNSQLKANEECDTNKALAEVKRRIKDKYNTVADIDQALDKAVGYINQYATALDLKQHFTQFYETKIWLKNYGTPDMREKLYQGKIPNDLSETQIAPTVKIGLTREVAQFLLDNSQININTLTLGNWPYTSYKKLSQYPVIKLKGILYSVGILYPACRIESICAGDQSFSVKYEAYNIYLINKDDQYADYTEKMINPEEQKSTVRQQLYTVANYIYNGKAPNNVNKIYYDAKDGWQISYK